MTEKLILRLRDVVDLTTISKSRLYPLMAREDDPFPRPIRLGPNSVGWRRAEVETWLAARKTSGNGQGLNPCPADGRARPDVASGTGAACLGIDANARQM